MLQARTIAHYIVRIAALPEGEREERMRAFEHFVTTRGIQHLMPAVRRYLERMSKQHANQDSVTITTAHALSETLQKDILSFIHADSSASVENTVDENVLGGFRALYRNTLYDSTLETQLMKLQQQLTH